MIGSGPPSPIAAPCLVGRPGARSRGSYAPRIEICESGGALVARVGVLLVVLSADGRLGGVGLVGGDGVGLDGIAYYILAGEAHPPAYRSIR